MENTPAERVNEIEAKCRRVEKRCDELQRLFEHVERERDYVRAKSKRRYVAIRRLLEQNRKLKNLLDSLEIELTKVLTERDKYYLVAKFGKVVGSTEMDDELSITLPIWKQGNVPPAGKYWIVSSICADRMFLNGNAKIKTLLDRTYAIGPLPENADGLFGGEGYTPEEVW